MADITSRIAGLSPEKRALLEKRLRQTTGGETANHGGAEPLAIIGVGCRFPGGARTPDAFWQVIANGVDAVVETPPDRWSIDELYDPDATAPGKVSTRWGGFIDQVDEFDATLFGIAPREAVQMDPQQRLLLETAWDALEHAGQSPDRLKGSRTGVFVGAHSHSADYALIQYGAIDDLDAFSGTGTSHNFLSGRLSYLLDLQGPSIVVDTACSSSLVAIHLACQSIRSGESTMALVGGVNLMLSPHFTIAASRMHMLSPTGRCKTFDASGDGFVRSEGCGVVVIKRLSTALSEGDRVLAVIRGSAVNQDGRTNGITAPNGLAQRRVIREALQNAGVQPHEVSYVEAHGTGTPLGDPIEVEALAATIGDPRPDGSTIALGSVKSNIGHLEGGAGVAGLIKAVLCLHKRQLPPLVHFTTLNPHISLEGTAFRIPTALEPWTPSRRRIAGVSSFGWSGTNAHVVLEEAPDPAKETAPADGKPRILPLSARSPEALEALARTWGDWCAGPGATMSLADVCDAAARRRAHHEHRVAIVAPGVAELGVRLSSMLAGESHPDVVMGRSDERSGIVFVFPGQGSQWLGMGRELYESEPAFRAAIDELDRALSKYVQWSLVEQIKADEASSRLSEIDVVQPVLFAIEVALAALWRARGVQPDAVVGHSMGEVAAAHVAGALSIDDAARVICLRSQLLRRVSGRGAMAAVELSMEETAAAIAGYEGRLSIAVSNSPTSTVLSGDADAIDQVLETLDERDVFCRRIKVDVASHSPQMDPLRGDLLKALNGLEPRAAAVPMYSTVKAAIAAGTELTPEYWVRNLREPVLMSKAVEKLSADGHTTFIEMSPHPILLPAIDTTIRALDRSGVTVPSLRRQESERGVMLSSAARLYVAGHAIDWLAVNGPGAFADIPRYQFQRERYWLDAPRESSHVAAAVTTGVGMHPIIGLPLVVADRPGARLWQFALEPRRMRYLVEHALEGTPLLPGSVAVELLLACAESLFGNVPVSVHDLELLRPLPIGADATPVLQMSAEPASDGRFSVKVFVIDAGTPRLLLTGTVEALNTGSAGQGMGEPRNGDGRVTGEEFYTALEARGVTIGPSLRNVTSVQRTDSGARAAIAIDQERARDLARYRIHPALSDGLFQATTAATGNDSVLYMPSRCREIRWYRQPTAQVHARLDRTSAIPSDGIAVTQDLRLFDTTGALVFEMLALELKPLGRSGGARVPAHIEDWVYQVEWQAAPADTHETVKQPNRQEPWVVFADRGGFGEAFVEWLARKGQLPTVVHADDTRSADEILDAALGRDAASCRGVVFARALDLRSEPATADALETSFRTSVLSALDVMQALARRAWTQSPRVWFVTQGAQRAAEGVTAPWQAPLVGFGRVVAEEHHELFGAVIDLDPAASRAENVEDLGSAIWSGDGAPEVAFRQRVRYVPRLARHAIPAGRSRDIRRDASYVVTGAFGAVGLDVARWLVAEGARRLVLIGRTALPERAGWSSVDPLSEVGRRIAAVRELEAAGASVHLASLAIEDERAAAGFFEAFERDGYPRVRGVVHCAALIEPGLIARTSPTAFAAALKAKATGAFVLDRLLPDLDFFVSFSSIAALLPQSGQGSYAAANAFLDALAGMRRRNGKAMLSVNWGVWRRPEIASDAVRQGADQYEAQGFGAFEPRDGVEALRRLLSQDIDNAIVVPIDWAQYRAARGAAQTPLVADVAAEVRADVDAAARAVSFRDALVAAPPIERRPMLEAHLQEHLARVLRLPVSRIEPLTPLGSLGLESLMTLEFRNRLQASLGIKLSATLVWNHPTVRALATHLAGRLDLSLDEPVAAQPVLEAPSAQATVDIAALSEEEALRALMENA